jgi:hypothetical protein
MPETVAVESISRLSKTSVRPARDAICINFDDGNHVVISPAMAFNRTVKSIMEIRIARNDDLLARITFNSRGMPFVQQPQSTEMLTRLAEYLQAAESEVNGPTSGEWEETTDLAHVRAVLEAVNRLYSPNQ